MSRTRRHHQPALLVALVVVAVVEAHAVVSVVPAVVASGDHVAEPEVVDVVTKAAVSAERTIETSTMTTTRAVAAAFTTREAVRRGVAMATITVAAVVDEIHEGAEVSSGQYPPCLLGILVLFCL